MVRILLCTLISTYLWAQGRPMLEPQELLKLIPEQIEGFKTLGEPVAKAIRIGTLSYSLAERSFVRGNQIIKILLFDYNNALIMYSQAVKGIGSSAGVSFAVAPDSLSGKNPVLYHEEIEKNHCRISMGINNRFFLNLSCQNTGAATLYDILEKLNFNGLERTSTDEAKFR